MTSETGNKKKKKLMWKKVSEDFYHNKHWRKYEIENKKVEIELAFEKKGLPN